MGRSGHEDTSHAEGVEEHHRRTWAELTHEERRTAVIMASLQAALALAAWTDLAYRPEAQVRGRKDVWALVIAVNWIGPILYFARGMRHRAPAIP